MTIELKWKRVNHHLNELPEGAIQTGEALCFIVLQYRQREQNYDGQWVTSAWKDVIFDD
jgi:hypothetical protein|tara:strand:+ start:623 stop:799 length:177 start_codon:yes stop_codon:yes gene_type:complete